MPLILPKQFEYECAPSGTHVAVCYRVVDLGTQTGGFAGELIKRHKVLISWELSYELMADGRPFSISRRYTLSSHKKAQLRLDLESWRGRAFTEEEFGTFDLVKILGHGCLLGIVHEQRGEQTYANVAGIMALPRGQQVPQMRNPPVYFALDAFDPTVYNALSEGLREVIARSPEYQALRVHGEQPPPPAHVPAPVPDFSGHIPGDFAQDPLLEYEEKPPDAHSPVFRTTLAQIYDAALKKGYSKGAVDQWLKTGATALQCRDVQFVPLSILEQWRTRVGEWPPKVPVRADLPHDGEDVPDDDGLPY